MVSEEHNQWQLLWISNLTKYVLLNNFIPNFAAFFAVSGMA